MNFLRERNPVNKKIPAKEARNLIGLHGKTLNISHRLDQDGWMSKEGSWFCFINTSKLSRR